MPLLNTVAHRSLASLGLGIARLRDPIREMAGLLDGITVTHAIDGGAYVGATIRRLREHFPVAAIHAFEPQTDTFDRLRTNMDGMRALHLYPYALSDHCGEQTFHVHETAYTSSLLTTQVSTMHPRGEQTVPVRTLDSVLAQADCSSGANVIKLDLQGHELVALRGAEQTLANCRAMLVEVNFRERYAGACSFEELAGYIGEHGLHLHRFYDVAVCGKDHGWLHGDALFVRR